MTIQTNHDPSRFSYYVTDDFYSELVNDFSDWQTEERTITDPVERDRFRQLVEREARILDNLLFEDWLKLFAPECAYWVPSTPEAGDPRHEIAVMFDDRRRLGRPRLSSAHRLCLVSGPLLPHVAPCCKR